MSADRQAARQATTAGALAHKFKSSVRSAGALALGELCFEMEKLARRAIMKTLLPGFEQELAGVAGFLEEC